VPVIVALYVTVPFPLTVALVPGASATEMCEEFELLYKLTVVLPLALATLKTMEAVALLVRLKELGLAVRVQAFVGVGLCEGDGRGVAAGVGVGVGDGLQF